LVYYENAMNGHGKAICILYAYNTYAHMSWYIYDVFITQWRDEIQNIIYHIWVQAKEKHSYKRYTNQPKLTKIFIIFDQRTPSVWTVSSIWNKCVKY